MEKDYWGWHRIKGDLEKSGVEAFFHEREIWLCSLGLNLGHEQDGKHRRFLRPVLLLKKFNNDIFWAVPLTSKRKTGDHYYQVIFESRASTVILSQFRLMDRKRLFRKIGTLNEEDFLSVRLKIIKLLT